MLGAVYPQHAKAGQVSHPTERLMVIRFPCAAVLDGLPAIHHMNVVTCTLRSIAFRRQLFKVPDSMKKKCVLVMYEL